MHGTSLHIGGSAAVGRVSLLVGHSGVVNRTALAAIAVAVTLGGCTSDSTHPAAPLAASDVLACETLVVLYGQGQVFKESTTEQTVFMQQRVPQIVKAALAAKSIAIRSEGAALQSNVQSAGNGMDSLKGTLNMMAATCRSLGIPVSSS